MVVNDKQPLNYFRTLTLWFKKLNSAINHNLFFFFLSFSLSPGNPTFVAVKRKVERERERKRERETEGERERLDQSRGSDSPHQRSSGSSLLPCLSRHLSFNISSLLLMKP